MIVDLSKYQSPSNINYDVFSKQLQMAICRVQDGSTYPDSTYPTHMNALTCRKVPCGAYAFVRGVNNSDMEKEAQNFYSRGIGSNPSFWMLDVEIKTIADMRGGINAYVAKLRTLTNKKIGVYISSEYYKEFNIDISKFDNVWLPRYGVNNGQISMNPDYYCDMHQYTSNGKLAGYSGVVDLSRFLNGRGVDFFTETTVTINQPSAAKTSPYTVTPGDTLGSVAANFKTTAAVLAELNGLYDPNILHVGQVLRIARRICRVQKGDTLASIASITKTSVNILASLNNLKDINNLKIGQLLIIE